MKSADLSGTYTYRSFLNTPEPVSDFNKLKFAQIELRLVVTADGTLTGKLMFSTAPELFMALTGTVTGDEHPHLVYDGRGLPGTEIADFHYSYDAVLLPTWPTAIGQVPTIAGTVLRVADHGAPPNVAHAGVTASFLAVKRPA